MRNWGVAALLVAGLGACATPAPPPPPPPPVAVAPPPRPIAPYGVSDDFVLPAKGLDGRFLTPNSNLDADETTFHFRSALNVAALYCPPDPLNPAFNVQTSYNDFLKRYKKVLAKANKAIDERYKDRFGKEGLRMRDTHMTGLYNYFARPALKLAFCAKATRHLAAVAALPAEQLPAYAAGALADIEGDFQNFYGSIETYQKALADWQAKYAAPPLAAAVSSNLIGN
jgi:hypothetical protein